MKERLLINFNKFEYMPEYLIHIFTHSIMFEVMRVMRMDLFSTQI